MKTTNQIGRLLIACGVFLIISCSDEKEALKGSITFSFQNKSTADGRINETASKLLVSIKDEQGVLLHDKLEISLYEFNGQFISQPLVLDAGDYTLEEFIVLNAANQVIYLSPIEGSDLAYLVEKPLAIDFSVKEDEVTNVIPEVIEAEGNSAIDFGYTTFTFEIVNTLKFLSSAFIYNSTNHELDLTSHTLTVKSGNDTLYHSAKPNQTTNTIIKSNYSVYALIFSKSGYQTETIQITKDDLLSKYQTTPLVIVFSDIILANGLVAHYSFSGGLAEDLTGNGNNGSISGAIPFADQLGRSNESIKFNSSDDYVKVNSPSFLSNNQGTFTAWVTFDNLSQTQYVGSVGDEQSIESYLSFLRIDGSDKTVGVYQREVGNANWLKGSTVLQMNRYYHLVILSTGTEWKIFINGQPENLNIVSGVNNGKWISDLSGIDNFTIGNLLIQSPYTIPYLSGKIDEVRLYNRALSQSEINILYNTTK